MELVNSVNQLGRIYGLIRKVTGLIRKQFHIDNQPTDYETSTEIYKSPMNITTAKQIGYVVAYRAYVINLEQQ